MFNRWVVPDRLSPPALRVREARGAHGIATLALSGKEKAFLHTIAEAGNDDEDDDHDASATGYQGVFNKSSYLDKKKNQLSNARTKLQTCKVCMRLTRVHMFKGP